MIIAPGFAFLMQSPEYKTKHLYIVISIIGNNTKALCVNVTTNKKNKDASCTLNIGDHKFVKHDSVINYGDALVPEINKLKEAIKMKMIDVSTPVDGDLLTRIINGAKISRAFPQGHLKYLSPS
ncbi:MAG: hypothetical protein GY775_20355 [Candidatus Scalindua sp.]|nr:hypothetical protein [Candidatus Scalindua sp.]